MRDFSTVSFRVRDPGFLNRREQREIAKELPALPRLAMNAAGALVRNGVQAIATGGRGIWLSDEAQAARQFKCDGGGDPDRACPFYRAVDQRCAHQKCGCWLKHKTAYVAEFCPDGRW